MTRRIGILHGRHIYIFIVAIGVVIMYRLVVNIFTAYVLRVYSKESCATCREKFKTNYKDDEKLKILFFTSSVNVSSLRQACCILHQKHFGGIYAGKGKNKKERFRMKKYYLIRWIRTYRVIIFHVKDMPGPRLLREVSLSRPHGQLRAYYNKESPYNTINLINGKFDHLFNLTITPLRNSDIFAPYGYYERKEERVHKTDVMKLKVRQIQHGINIPFESKPLLVAWVVSNCGHRRDNFITALLKYLPIDIYGRCSVKFNQAKRCERDSYQCEAELQKYKFVIAFENSFCDDYITEKYWDAIFRGNVPIVLGGRKYDEKVVIPGSFIQARSFHSAKSLAEYIKYAANDKKEYEKYLQWRELFTLNYDPNNLHRLDKIVDQLHTTLHNGFKNNSYVLSSFYSRRKNCVLEINDTSWNET
ncbi:alpha-(1,3)-fucosyltransferase C-like [Hydractinia symbiolongicarpus]|uniref:alpha-(1,3)-fucosyltransferase C-like n=1 Tax=Hydractinia symbiolongicarpus TaxID=13093 RepID=UPI00254EDAE6|nr:alpha-(1,3)-fucosyltransferase C-like [Hydractinia symbiolongicarpus]